MACAAAALLWAAAAHGQAGSASDAPASVADLWLKGSDQVLAGDFARAVDTLRQARRLDPRDGRIQEALSWVESTIDHAAEREALRKKVYAAHLDAAKKLIERAKWEAAINHVRQAGECAVSRGELQSLPWLDELVGNVEKKIAEHRAAGKWLDALIMYEVLARVYEEHPRAESFKQQARFCRKRAHFETFYAKDGVWQEQLADIRARMVEEAFGRVARYYYVEPDFRRMVLEGLDNLLVLAETPQAAAALPQLADADRRGTFVSRLKGEIARVSRRDKLSLNDALSVFDTVREMNDDTLQLKEAVLTYEMLTGSTAVLDDFTSVIWPAEVDDFDKHTQGEFTGVGIQITQQEDGGEYIRVETPLEDTPAFEADIRPGDLITGVDGLTTKGMKLTDAVKKITGPIGTRVRLTIQRQGQEPFDVSLVRRVITIHSVKGYARKPDGVTWDYLIDPEHKIGYVRVTQFTQTTRDELTAALTELRRQGARGLILDLRFNPGGLLSSAVQVCELFLDAGDPIVKTQGREQTQGPAVSESDGKFASFGPIITLVNEASASASEILSGALAGNGKSLILGERTFGKGSVQNLYEIARRSAYFKMTTSLYYVPEDPRGESWRCLHRNEGDKTWGVEPHIAVKLIPQEIRKVWELRRQSDLIRARGAAEEPPLARADKGKSDKSAADRPDKDKDSAEAPDKSAAGMRAASAPASQPDDDIVVDIEAPDRDPQLDTALAIMRMKLVSQQPWVLAPRIGAPTPPPAGG